jgi:hypothetical protein
MTTRDGVGEALWYCSTLLNDNNILKSQNYFSGSDAPESVINFCPYGRGINQLA